MVMMNAPAFPTQMMLCFIEVLPKTTIAKSFFIIVYVFNTQHEKYQLLFFTRTLVRYTVRSGLLINTKRKCPRERKGIFD